MPPHSNTPGRLITAVLPLAAAFWWLPLPADGMPPASRRVQATGYSGFTRMQHDLARAYSSGPAGEWFQRTPLGGPVAEDEFTTAIIAAGQRGEVEEMLRLAVQALVVCPADEGFPVRVSRVVECLQLVERARGKAVPSEIAQPVFAVATAMPKDHFTHQSGEVARASHSGYAGDYVTQRAVAESLLGNPALMERVRPAALALLGSALENLGQSEAAASTYARIHGDEVDEQYSRFGIRAVLLYLHTGHFDEADRLLGELQHLPASTLALAEGGEQIEGLLRLRRKGQAREYWQRWAAWWPQWEAIVAAAELPPAGVETTTPLLGGEAMLGYPAPTEFSPGSTRQFLQRVRRHVSAARWSPEVTATVAAFSDEMDAAAPALGGKFRKLCVAMLEAAQDRMPGTAEFRERQFQRARLYSLDGEYDAALALVHALRADPDVSLDFRGRIDEVWAYTAVMTGRDIAEAVGALRADLRGDVMFADRVAAVSLAAKAYAALNDRASETGLIAAELDHPDIRRDRSGWARLATHLEVIRGQEGEPRPAQNSYARTEIPPRTLRKVPAAYPAVLQDAGINGTVVVEFVVDPNGSVISVRVVSSPNDMLSELAVAAVAKWEFEPARRDGQPIAMRMHVPLSFGFPGAAMTAIR